MNQKTGLQETSGVAGRLCDGWFFSRSKVSVRSQCYIPAEALSHMCGAKKLAAKFCGGMKKLFWHFLETAARGEVTQAGTGRLLDAKYNGWT